MAQQQQYPLQNVEVYAVAYGGVRYKVEDVDGEMQAVPSLDQKGNPQEYWDLHWRQDKRVDTVRVYAQHMNREWSTQGFWERQDLNGVKNTIQKIKSKTPVHLDNPLPATVQYRRRRRGGSWMLIEINQHLAGQTQSAAAAPVQQDSAQVEQNTAAIAEIQGDMKQMMALLQQMVNKQQ